MQQIQFTIPVKSNPAPHEKAYYCDLIAKIIHRPIKQVLGFTKDWPLEMIKDSYLLAKSAKNSDKAWWWYRKQTRI